MTRRQEIASAVGLAGLSRMTDASDCDSYQHQNIEEPAIMVGMGFSVA